MIPESVKAGLAEIIRYGLEPYALRELLNSLQNKLSVEVADNIVAQAELKERDDKIAALKNALINNATCDTCANLLKPLCDECEPFKSKWQFDYARFAPPLSEFGEGLRE